ncbi:hypothetical protein L228DRAFT_249948 [Xylona heveae TC161]|uniref:Uncharacterized protein n=1 Tax=Xylona heveae (strain CBS 132557 / TC161) TaxID=1328760 RepID=A0A165ACZ1_XYLHT|nr:hypothetical protein L228DRAFT_249948 [Xylona heveae TC161]KZF20272.1 hypothetical protein L228DRAFT_249948 [Xylona heveae TC161]
MGGLLAEALSLNQAYEVYMDEVKFVLFDPTGPKRSVGTAGLNGCSVVTIISPLAAILAHLPPHPGRDWHDPYAADRHVEAKMNELINLYRHVREYFRPENTTWVISAMFDGQVALPDQREIIENKLREAGLTSTRSTYMVVDATLFQGPGQGTVFVDARGGPSIVYVGDRALHLP